MEIIKLSKNDIQKQFSNYQNLNEIVKVLEQQHQAFQKVICSIFVNDLRLSEKDEARLGTTPLHAIESLEIHIENLTFVVQETIHSLKSLVVSLRREVLQLAEQIKEKRDHVTHTSYVNIILNLQDLINALQAVRPHLPTIVSADLLDQRWRDGESKLLSALQEFVIAIERQDYVLVSDVLEYEIEGGLAIWQDIIDSVD